MAESMAWKTPERSATTTKTLASSTTALAISNKLNCFVTSRSLDHPTFVRNCPQNDNGNRRRSIVATKKIMVPGDRQSMKDQLCADGRKIG